MASSLSSYVIHSDDDQVLRQVAAPGVQLAAKLAQVRLKPSLTFDDDIKKAAYVWFAMGIVGMHLLAVWAYLHYENPPLVLPAKHEVAIEFITVDTPPPVVEPPPPPPPPKVQKVAPPPQPIAAMKTAPAAAQVAANDITIQENTRAEATSAPVMAASGPLDKSAAMPEAAPPAPPAPKVEEPITEATANAGHLNNPHPKYPKIAERNGWYGTVVVRVRVLASGQPESATVFKSSGKKVLDDAAIETIMQSWKFVPAKRGSTPIDGWATQPITFKPE